MSVALETATLAKVTSSESTSLVAVTLISPVFAMVSLSSPPEMPTAATSDVMLTSSSTLPPPVRLPEPIVPVAVTVIAPELAMVSSPAPPSMPMALTATSVIASAVAGPSLLMVSLLRFTAPAAVTVTSPEEATSSSPSPPSIPFATASLVAAVLALATVLPEPKTVFAIATVVWLTFAVDAALAVTAPVLVIASLPVPPSMPVDAALVPEEESDAAAA